MAKRDEVWHSILVRLTKTDEFRISDFQIDVSDHTIRRVCRFMEKHAWLERDSESSSVWRRGPLADVFLAKREWSQEIRRDEDGDLVVVPTVDDSTSNKSE